ncbi:hypothetical protein SH1V18_18920 [Vallitalea longa]|uniref:Heparinase II N-terminal domain-containing protein n=1 Tax=Vallitalea longa TaxID=2936439 RepID=A0A9W5Y9K5_9FIRM|nr:DUF4962 domain-containing protein [Vallitalea longa]GKX29412.1 hypothetical protein SH1V18_18920 [Vallitalea longa]
MDRYIFINNSIENLRKEIKTTKADFFKRLYEQCRLYANAQLPEEHPKASTTYMGMGCANLSLAYLLTKQQHYLDEARRWIFTCVNYPHWGNAHLVDVDLSAAWILFGLGLSYDWLKDDLEVEERKKLREKIILQAEIMYKFKVETEGEGWSTNYFQNHNWINLTGLATAGYALADEYPRAQKWIDSAKENFDFVYSVLANDGSDYEGVVYWRYGAMWLFIYAHLLKEREGIDYFRKCDFLKNTFYYRLYQAAPNLEEQINFGDCHDRRSGHSTAIYYKVAAEYNNGHAQKLANLVREKFLYREASESQVKPGILPECLFELLFYDPKVEEKDFDDLDLVRYFEDLGLVVIRSSWSEDATHFSFKTSYPGGKTQWDNLWKLKEEKNYNCFGLSHQHPDNNSFILNSNNTFLTIDDGYNRTVKASDHNVVIVDGKGYEDENQNNIWKNYTKDMVGEIETFRNEEHYVYVVGETSRMYKKELKLRRFARHVLHTKNSYFIVMDELMSDDPHKYTFVLHSDVFPQVQQNGEFLYENGPAQMKVINVSPVETEYELLENNVRAIMTTQQPDKFRECRMKTLHISNKSKQKDLCFLNVIMPSKADDNSLVVEKINTEDCFGVEIIDKDSSEILLYSYDDKVKYKNNTYDSKGVLLKLQNNIVQKVIKL